MRGDTRRPAPPRPRRRDADDQTVDHARDEAPAVEFLQVTDGSHFGAAGAQSVIGGSADHPRSRR
jgi:hypothetical protein